VGFWNLRSRDSASRVEHAEEVLAFQDGVLEPALPLRTLSGHDEMMTFTENEEKVLKDVWSEAIPLLEYVSVTCDVIGKLFVAPPDQAGLSSMSSMEIDQEIEEVGSTNIVKGMRLIAAFGRQDDPAQSILNAIADHSRLFVGPIHLFSPQWSSNYLDIKSGFGTR
jgi:TorA maturation chaperone TorD